MPAAHARRCVPRERWPAISPQPHGPQRNGSARRGSSRKSAPCAAWTCRSLAEGPTYQPLISRGKRTAERLRRDPRGALILPRGSGVTGRRWLPVLRGPTYRRICHSFGTLTRTRPPPWPAAPRGTDYLLLWRSSALPSLAATDVLLHHAGSGR